MNYSFIWTKPISHPGYGLLFCLRKLYTVCHSGCTNLHYENIILDVAKDFHVERDPLVKQTEVLKFVTGETALKSKKIWKIGKIIYLLRAWENSGSDLDKRQNNIENYPTFLKQVTDIIWGISVYQDRGSDVSSFPHYLIFIFSKGDINSFIYHLKFLSKFLELGKFLSVCTVEGILIETERHKSFRVKEKKLYPFPPSYDTIQNNTESCSTILNIGRNEILR